MPDPAKTDYYLDISDEVCPITFVKTKLLLERVEPGRRVKIRLKGAEPRENVPRSVEEMGHRILACTPESGEEDDGFYILEIETRG